MRKSIFFTGAGIGLFAVAAAEGAAFAQKGQPACEWRPPYRDFGPPSDCGNDPGQHPRGTVVTSLATAGSTLALSMGTVVVFEPEHYRPDQISTTISKLS